MVLVIQRQFLASSDSPHAEEHNAPLHPPRSEIGVATVVDTLGAAPADFAIQTPAAVQTKYEARQSPTVLQNVGDSRPHLFGAETHAGVFDHFAPRRYCLGGEHTQSLNTRTPNQQPIL